MPSICEASDTGALMILGAIVFAIVAAFRCDSCRERRPRVDASRGEPGQTRLPIAGPVTLQPDPEHDIAQFRTREAAAARRLWLDRSRHTASRAFRSSGRWQLLANPAAASGSK